MTMLFFTVVTPRIVSARRPAWNFCSAVFTNPLSCTTPLNVSTVTSMAFTTGSFTKAAFTLSVIVLSSTNSPVLSFVAVEAQPALNAKKPRLAVNKAARAMGLNDVFIVNLTVAQNRFGFSRGPI